MAAASCTSPREARAARWFASAMFGLLLSGCGDGVPSAQHQGISSLSERPGSVVMVDTLSGLCPECVTVEEFMALGDTAGPGIYEGSRSVVVDDLGRFWVIHQNRLTVFDSSGAYVKTSGREGQGPGEFVRASLGYLSETGAVHVFDSRSQRLTALDRGGDVVFMENVSGVVRSTKSHPDSGAVVNLTPLDQAGRVVAASHLVRGARIAEYTTPESAALADNVWRSVAVDGAGVVYAAKQWDYVIDVWTEPGEPIGRIERPGLWERSPVGSNRALVPGGSPAATIPDISVVNNRWLIVVSRAKTEDWEDWVEEVGTPDGQSFLVPTAGTDKLFDTYVEVIDLESFELVSTTRLPWLVEGVVNDSILFGTRMDGRTPQLVLSRVSITERDQTQ